MKRIYFDYNATTPVDPAVSDFAASGLTNIYGNPSSIHREGRAARRAVDEARERVASLINCSAPEIVFCGSGSESNNLAIKGIVEANENRGKHLITSQVEHPSVLKTFKYLENRGWTVTFLDVDEMGTLDPEDLKSAIREDTVLVSLMMANNETGVIFPIREAAAIARERGVLFHTDAVQAVGKINVDVDDLNVDLLSLAGHKFYAPKGIGALYVRSGAVFGPLIHGGGQEDGRRGGTENIAGIMGLAKSAEMIKCLLRGEMDRLKTLKLHLKKGIEEKVEKVIFNVDHEHNLPNTLSVCFKGVSGESLLMALDLEGFALSAGSACSSGALSSSHVLTAMGLDEERINGTLRFSLGRWSEKKEIDLLLSLLPSIIERLDKKG